ncbi:MAG: BspA family leucine-rich repeat surface protein [Bacteroidota bacterium]|nr:BspA family leucine-rich repeat surface protein [Bacteroidota bacterium]
MIKTITKLQVAILLILGISNSQAQPFITEWNLSISGSNQNRISFGVGTSGIVSYQWATIPTTTTGIGTFTGTNATISGLPTNSRISLSIDGNNFNRININGGNDRSRLTNVAQWGNVIWISMDNAFSSCSNLQIYATDVPNLTSVTSMNFMLGGCTVLNSPANINSWNTSNVKNMSGLFYLSPAFNQNISSWNIANVTNTGGMFYGADSFIQDIRGWNTSNVKDMNNMFAFNDAFNQSIGGWNTSNVTNMNRMFWGASVFNQNLSGWNTSKVTDMMLLFAQTSAYNQNIENWDVSKVVNMQAMFYNATAFNQNLGPWGTKLNTTVNLSDFFLNSAMSSSNYDATLQGFSTSTILGRKLDANGL